MPYTLDQLDFLGVHVGVAIPPEFIENKRRVEKYKQRLGEISARAEEMKQRHDGSKLEELFLQATAAAEEKNFANALDLLDQVEVGLNAPDLPPPPVEPPPQPPQELEGKEVEEQQVDLSTPEGVYRSEKAKLIAVINAAAQESAEVGGEDIRSWIEKMEAKEQAADWPAATELLKKAHQKAELLNARLPFIKARQEHIHKINAAKKIKVEIPKADKSFGSHKTYGDAVTADWDAALGLAKNNDFKGAANAIIALANKIDTKITPAVAKAREENAKQLTGLKDELEKAKKKGDAEAMRRLANDIFKNTSAAEGLGVDPGENARKPFTPDAVWTVDKCEATFVAYDWFALKKCRKARKITIGSDELAFSDDDMWKLVQYRGKVVNEVIDSLRKEYPTLIAKASGSEDIESDIDITFATPGSGDDVKAAEKFNAVIIARFKKPAGRVFDVNIYPRDYGAIKESFKADYNVEEIKDEGIDEPDQEESAKLSKIDQDVATLLKQRRFLDADKFNAMLKTLLDSAPDKATKERIEKQYEEGEDIYLLTSLEKVEKIRAKVDLGKPSEGESKHKKALREKLAQLDSLKKKGDRDSLAKAQSLIPEILDLFEEEMPAETMDVTDALYLEKMGALREDQQSIRSLKNDTGPADSHHPGKTCEEVHPKKEHEAWRKEHLNALEVKVKKDMFTNIVFANEAIMSQGALKHVVVALQAKTKEEKEEALELLEASDLMQSVNEQVADLAKEMKHYEGVVEEAEETGGDEAEKESAKRVAIGEGFVHASKYFFRLLDAAILLTEKYKDNEKVSAVVSKPYDALKTRQPFTLEALKKRVDDVLLKLRKSAVIPPDVKGEVGVLEIKEIFESVDDIGTFRKMITNFAIELNLRIRSMEDFKKSQEMQPKEGERLSEAEKAYFKAAAPKPGKEEEQEEEELPPLPNIPLPPIPPEAADAVRSVLKSAKDQQGIVRDAAKLLMQLQGTYIEAQGKREGTPKGEAYDKLTKDMSDTLANIKSVAESQSGALAKLLELEQTLKGINPNAQGAPPNTPKLHQQATQLVTDSIAKARTVSQNGAALHDKLAKALAEGGTFMAKDGVKAYEPDAFELPEVLRSYQLEIEQTAKRYQDAQGVLQPLLKQANELLAVVAKGRPLPDGSAKTVGDIEQNAAAAAKDFGKWNGAIIKPWRGLDMQVKQLDKNQHADTIELFRRCATAFDNSSRQFDVAGRTNQEITNVVKLLRESLAPVPATANELNEAIKSKTEAIKGDYDRLEKPLGQLAEKAKTVPAKKKQFASVDPSQIIALDSALEEINRDIQTVETNINNLELAGQGAGTVDGLIKSRFSAKGVNKKLVTDLKSAATRVEKAIETPLKNGRKALADLQTLRDDLQKKRAALGKLASVEETNQLRDSLSQLPQLPGKDALLPTGGAKKWKAETAKGGDKKAATLFANVTKAWELAEKKADEKSLDALEKAAGLFLNYYASLDDEAKQDPTDAQRAEKAREALRAVRKLRLQQDRDSLPEPPWSEATALKAKQLEATILLENGTPAKAPSAKGESDSFFVKNSEGKPAFIFKPKQGENVKSDLGGREGEGVVREVLTSKFNDQMKEMTGVDFGVSPTGIARLESDSFANGEKSKEKSRVGALQQAVPNEGSLLDKLAEDPSFAKSVKKEDVQKVAMMDFLTLQGDRNAGNLLIQEVNGEKRLVPIDGGFAFPDKKLFGMASSGMSSEPMDFSGPPPTSEDELAKAKGQLEGKNALMLLPQSQEKFSDEMLKSIDALDPDAMAKGLKKSNAEISGSAPEVGGLVGDENIENVRRSALFLKKAAREFTVAELSEVYALDFKRVLEAPAKQLDKEIAAVIQLGKKRAEFNRNAKAGQSEYDQLGGDAEIVKLGWDPKADRVLRLNLKRKIEILKKREQAPVPPPKEPSPTKPQKDDTELEREYKSLGGDKELAKFMARPDAGSPKVAPKDKVVMRVGRVRLWKEFRDLGGDAAYKKLVADYRANQYEPFDTLPKKLQAAVATFAGQSWDPDGFDVGSKVTALKDYKAFSK